MDEPEQILSHGPSQAIAPERALRLLSEGDIELHGLLPWSSNYTFLVTVSDGELEAAAVYKPCRGERPLWDFPEGTLAMREVAAYRRERSARLGTRAAHGPARWPARHRHASSFT